jgi:hypothetical protein
MPPQRANARGLTQEVQAPMQGERYPDWLMERFWAKVDKTESCWLWTASCNGGGYGMFRDAVMERRADAHRFSYEFHVGAIPAGLVLDHLCRNRNCVNPEHLEAVTQRVNVHRGLRGPANVTHCPQGHPYEGENVIYATDGARKCRACNRIRNRENGLQRLSDKQRRVLAVAVRNGRWWITGKGSNMVVAGLVQRGLVDKRWELIAGRARHYVVATDAGVLLDGGEVRSLDAARNQRRGA